MHSNLTERYYMRMTKKNSKNLLEKLATKLDFEIQESTVLL